MGMVGQPQEKSDPRAESQGFGQGDALGGPSFSITKVIDQTRSASSILPDSSLRCLIQSGKHRENDERLMCLSMSLPLRSKRGRDPLTVCSYSDRNSPTPLLLVC
jgi:hypothetical protein